MQQRATAGPDGGIVIERRDHRVLTVPMVEVLAHLAACGIALELGPGERAGALRSMQSVYLRDLDGNLIELSKYVS